MRALIAAALVIAGAIALPPPSPTPAKAGKKPEGTAQQKAQEASATDGAAKPSVSVINQSVCPQVTVPSPDCGTQISEKAATDWWITAFTAALVVVAVLQFLAMRKQATYMRRGLIIAVRSARAAKRSANAALLNAQAAKRSVDLLIDSERPWVIVTVRKDSQDTFPFSLINCGRTPANILFARTYDVFVPIKESIPTQPSTAPHTVLDNFGIIAPKEIPDETTELDKIRLVEDELGKENFLHVRTMKITFVRYIEIVYRNTLDQSIIHETKTCYYYDFMRARFMRMHLPGYTTQT